MTTATKKYFSLAALLVALAALFWVYYPVLNGLIKQMLSQEDSSYGLLLPLVAAFIVYRRWPQVKAHLWQPSWWGLVIIAVGFLGYLVSQLWSDLLSARVSFLIVLAGILCLMGGRPLLRELIFPLFLLALMFPLPLLLTRQLSLPLQRVSSEVATWMLNVIGYQVLLQGNVIDLGDRQLEVVAACSGLRYLLNLLYLGIVFCYFFQRRAWKVAVLLGSVFPYAIIANALRLTLIGIFPILEKGWWHTSIGMTIFIFGFDYLKAVNWGVNKIQAPPADSAAPEPGALSATPQASWNLQPAVYLATGALLILLGGSTVHSLATVAPTPLHQSLAEFPLTIDSWQGRHIPVEPGIMKALQADETLHVNYYDPAGVKINLWIAYYANVPMAGGIHSPMLCLTSGGWDLRQRGTVAISPQKSVTYMVMHEMNQDMLVNYWYIQQHRWLTSLYAYKFNMIFDKLIHRRSDAALVRLITPLEPSREAAQARLTEFAARLATILPRFIPE